MEQLAVFVLSFVFWLLSLQGLFHVQICCCQWQKHHIWNMGHSWARESELKLLVAIYKLSCYVSSGYDFVTHRLIHSLFLYLSLLFATSLFLSPPFSLLPNSLFQYRALVPLYYRGAAAAIIVYDITDEESYERMESWIDEMQRLGPPNVVLAIAGNKCDLKNERKVKFKTHIVDYIIHHYLLMRWNMCMACMGIVHAWHTHIAA